MFEGFYGNCCILRTYSVISNVEKTVERPVTMNRPEWPRSIENELATKKRHNDEVGRTIGDKKLALKERRRKERDIYIERRVR